MKEKIRKFFSELPSKTKDYFRHLNYPFYLSMIILAIGLFLSDYFTKHLAYDYHVVNNNAVGKTIIPYILNLTYIANDGAAWGSFSGKMWALCIISMIASIALTFNILFRFDKYNKWMTVGMVLMAPGAIGNLVDRIGCLAGLGIYKKGVIDFLQFTFWPSFPICNLADYYLTIGVVLLLVGFVLEFRKEWKEMKEEEKKEKEAEASGVFRAENGIGEEDMKKKLHQLDEKKEKDAEEKKDD